MHVTRPKEYPVFRSRVHQNQQRQPVSGHDNPRHVLRPVPRFQIGKSPLQLLFLHDVLADALPRMHFFIFTLKPYQRRAVFHLPLDTPHPLIQHMRVSASTETSQIWSHLFDFNNVDFDEYAVNHHPLPMARYDSGSLVELMHATRTPDGQPVQDDPLA